VFDTFYGYYDSGKDYFTHIVGHESVGIQVDSEADSVYARYRGVDFRNNIIPVTDKHGIYSTTLFTEAIEQHIMNHDSDNGPFFIYALYQAVNSPLEAPQKYIDQCQDIPYDNQ